MGRTYHAKSNKKLVFDVNWSGADLLALLHEEVGLGLIPKRNDIYNDLPPCTKFSMTEKETNECAEAISKIDLQKFIENVKKKGWNWDGLCGMTFQELEVWVKEWVKFLKESKGYEAD